MITKNRYSEQHEPNTKSFNLLDIVSGTMSGVIFHADSGDGVCAMETEKGEWLDLYADDIEEIVLHLCRLYRTTRLPGGLKNRLMEILSE